MWLSSVQGTHSQPWGPLSPLLAVRSIFFFISLGFWLMSVTATGNKMLVRVFTVALERRLWYIVKPFASVSWLPCHRVHVYWLRVNKAKASSYFTPASFAKGEAAFDVEAMLLSGIVNAFVVASALLLAPPLFFLHCMWSCGTLWVSHLWLLLSLLGINWRC